MSPRGRSRRTKGSPRPRANPVAMGIKNSESDGLPNSLGCVLRKRRLNAAEARWSSFEGEMLGGGKWNRRRRKHRVPANHRPARASQFFKFFLKRPAKGERGTPARESRGNVPALPNISACSIRPPRPNPVPNKTKTLEEIGANGSHPRPKPT